MYYRCVVNSQLKCVIWVTLIVIVEVIVIKTWEQTPKFCSSVSDTITCTVRYFVTKFYWKKYYMTWTGPFFLKRVVVQRLHQIYFQRSNSNINDNNNIIICYALLRQRSISVLVNGTRKRYVYVHTYVDYVHTYVDVYGKDFYWYYHFSTNYVP